MAREHPCPNLEDNKKDCTCQSTQCPRHGKCCECVHYHREQGNLPVCLR